MKKIVILDMKELLGRTSRFDVQKSVPIDIKKCYSRIIWFTFLIVLVVYIGYQIGRDAASRDERHNTIKIEMNK